MKVTATELRANLYRILDRVLDTGEAVEVERKGRRVRLVPGESPTGDDLLARLTPHPDYIVGDPDDLVHLDWSDAWKP